MKFARPSTRRGLPMPVRRRYALLALVCWAPFTACFCPVKQGSVAENTPQGLALKRVRDEGRVIVPTAEGTPLPLTFRGIVIEESEHGLPFQSKKEKRYRALLPWELTGSPEEALAQLHESVRKQQPDALPGTARIRVA